MTHTPRSSNGFPSHLLRVLPGVVLVVLMSGLIASWVAKDILYRQLQEHLEVQAGALTHATQARFDTVKEATRALASNQLMINALIDVADRDTYLPAFFQSLTLPGPHGAAISLTDYRGRVIASTGDRTSYEGVAWLSVIEHGQEHFSLTPRGLVVAVPVVYAGSPEGVVVVEYTGDQVSDLVAVPKTGSTVLINHRDGWALHTSTPDSAATAQISSQGDRDALIESSASLPDYPDVTVVAALSRKDSFATWDLLDRLLMIALVLDLVMLALGVLSPGRAAFARVPVVPGGWWPPATVVVVVALATGLLWAAQSRQERDFIRSDLKQTHRLVAGRIATHLEYRVTALERMAIRWSQLGQPERRMWDHDAARYVLDFGDFQAIEWVDPSLHVRWVIPLEGNEQVVGIKSAADDQRLRALEEARVSGQTMMTPPITLLQGGKGALIYCPIGQGDRFGGFVLGVLKFERLLEDIHSRFDWEGLSAQVSVLGQTMTTIHPGDGDDRVAPSLSHTETADLYGVPWTVEVSQQDAAFTDFGSSLKGMTLVIGATLGVLLVVVTRLSQGLLGRSRQMAQANEQLEAEVADRNQAEQRLRVSEERFNLAVTGSSDGLWDWFDPDRDDALWWSNRFCELLGYKQDQLVPSIATFRDLLHPADRDGVDHAIREHLEARQPYDIEHRLKTQAGEYRWFRSRGQAVWDDQGQATRFSGSIQDINDIKENQRLLEQHALSLETEIAVRHRVEEALRDSEAHQAAILETAADAIITIDQHGAIDSLNAAAERLFGYAADEVVGQNVNMLMPEPYKQEHDGYLRRYQKTGEKRIMGGGREVIGLRKDTTTFPMYLSVGEFQRAGQMFYSGIIQDLTRRKLAEEQFQRVFASSPNALVMVDAQGIIRIVNGRVTEWFGYAEDELIGQPVEILVPQRHRQMHARQVKGFFQAPTIRPMGASQELFGCRKDGSELPLDISINPIETEHGTMALASIVDITERTERARKISEHAAHLEKLTDDLTRRNEELDEFTYVASHDLQEPLRKLISFSSLLRKDAGDDLAQDAQTDLKYISEAADRMQNLVQDLLSLSRTGRGDITVKSVALQECATGALDSLETRVAETGAMISIGDLPEVMGDRTLLTQLYQNLIGNAIKYCKNSPIIQLTAEEEAGVWVFGVRDNGIGIEPQYQEQVFAPFKRLHGRGEYEGTGIGLATCKKVVERHGGELWVESELGQGSHFKFTLGAKRKVTA